MECREGHHQTSPTAGTVFHGARVPLWKWFWAMYQEAHSKKGLSAMALTGHHLRRFAVKAIAKGSKLRTDGWGAYRVVAKAGYEHEPIITGSGREAVQTFPWIHPFIGNMKRMILGTYHSVSPKHLDRYLAAFAYRANRRWQEANLFDRLVIAAIDAKPLTFKELTTGAR